MAKYVGSVDRIKYVFMTDDHFSYPETQIAQIKQLKAQIEQPNSLFPKRIDYIGIEFHTNGDTMKLIGK